MRIRVGRIESVVQVGCLIRGGKGKFPAKFNPGMVVMKSLKLHREIMPSPGLACVSSRPLSAARQVN